MKWSREANEAIAKVPFFVRKRVEEEAIRYGVGEVLLDHVKTCQRPFLNQMEDEVKGYQVDTCFGPSGCPNRALISDDFSKKIEERLAGRNLKSFLTARGKGLLKMHHEFRISISDCPNACSRPQIVDVGLIGARSPKVLDITCNQCGACIAVCREGAISLTGQPPLVDPNKCLSCGQCIPACTTGTLQDAARGYRILVGGKLGRHPALGRELPEIYSLEEALKVVDHCLDHYQRYCLRGERFGEILGRTGVDEVANEVFKKGNS
jgi:dissimilatory sulfite reductase (desulfoviridin) alpha/beta subunit